MTQIQETHQKVAPREFTRQIYTPEQRQFYAENGYLILRNIISGDKLARLQAQILEEFQNARQFGKLFAGGGTISGHINCYPGSAASFIYDELKQQGIIEIVKVIAPKSIRLPNLGCNLNLPKSVPQHYHADRPFTQEFMIVNVAVVDTDLVNGAIDVLPGTHRKFYKFWRYTLERVYKRTTRLPLKQGDVLIRTSNLWHRGMPNYSPQPRPMVAFTWEDGGSFEEDPFNINEGKIVFRENWYRKNFLGRLREYTFVKAPISYSTYRFVRSLFGNKGF